MTKEQESANIYLSVGWNACKDLLTKQKIYLQKKIYRQIRHLPISKQMMDISLKVLLWLPYLGHSLLIFMWKH